MKQRKQNSNTIAESEVEVTALGATGLQAALLLADTTNVKPTIKVNNYRVMSVPDETELIAVAGDRYAECVNFEVSRYSTCYDLNNGKRWFIETLNAKPETPEYNIVEINADALEITDELITFQWVVDPLTVAYPGDVQLRLMVLLYDEATDTDFLWRSQTGIFTVYKTFLPYGDDPAPYPGLSYIEDAINKIDDMMQQAQIANQDTQQLILELSELVGDINNVYATATRAEEPNVTVTWEENGLHFSFELPKGDMGYYFTPHIDEEGNISWSNNGLLPNPTVVNIKGPKGDEGGTFRIIGNVTSASDLPDATTLPDNDAYIVGASAPYELYVIEVLNGVNTWFNAGTFNAVAGEPGIASSFTIVQTNTIAPGLDASVSEAAESTPQDRRYIVNIPRGEKGDVEFATFDVSIENGHLYVTYPDGMEDVQFELRNGHLFAIINVEGTSQEMDIGAVGFNPVGEYDAGTQYKRLDIVFSTANEASYIAVIDSIGQDLLDETYWMPYGGVGSGNSEDAMLIYVYDTNRSGVVDDSERLGAQPPSYYASQAALTSGLNIKSNINHTHSQYITEETDPNIFEWAKQAAKPTYTASEIGLGNVNNTSDLNKPISLAMQTALDGKASTSHTHDPSSIGAVARANPVVDNTSIDIPSARNIYAGTTALVSGVSNLPTGSIYLQYE